MFTAIAITLLLALTLGVGLLAERTGVLIAHRPYNNRYNDAAGAREDHVG
jgi:hypothetical protein